ncbi:MAG: 30S ribosomal protein S4 [Candidatus Micrarchaeales archaeon]
MGDPKRIRKKYETPSKMWDSVRIEREHELKSRYGLKNLRELWLLASEIRRMRKNVREVLSGKASEKTGKEMIVRLSRYNIVKGDATLDDLLIVGVEALLERRLQTIVFRKGMARTIKQARQLVAHGLISIKGKRVKSPGYLVLASEDTAIEYYKPIVIQQPSVQAVPAAPQESPTKEGAGVSG